MSQRQHAQDTVLSNWSRLYLSQRQTRKERAEFPRAIPHVFADARELPVRLLKGKRLTRLVQYTGLACLLVASLTDTGCSAPTEPTAADRFSPSQWALVDTLYAAERPRHHNIPATLAGHPDGTVYWLCETQPRTYVIAGTQRRVIERDHYLQTSECPKVPIE